VKLQKKSLEKLRKLINEETEYRSGPVLVSFFNALGFDNGYGQGFPSRWIFTDGKLAHINGTPKIEECIKILLSPVNFITRFDQLDKFISEFNQYLAFDGYKIVRSSKEIFIKKSDEMDSNIIEDTVTDDEFLKKEFSEISLKKLYLDSFITETLKLRFDEIKKCLSAKAPLSVIFLAGSSLEGILLGIALSLPKEFNQSKVSPKDKNGKVLPFQEWTLNNFIDVAYDTGRIKEDVKKFSHSLRDFRNYIHPYEQVSSKFTPSEQTAKICWQVLKAAIFQLTDSIRDKNLN
jgi:hypothetical protein